MCHAPLPAGKGHSAATRTAAPRQNVFVPTRDRLPKRRISGPESGGQDFALGTWIVVALNCGLGLVGIGLWLQAPGYAILYMLVVSPAMIALFVSQERRERREGRSTLDSVGDFIDTYFSALAKTVALLSLLTAATFSALFLFCCALLYSGTRP
jgi:hypothetical protein